MSNVSARMSRTAQPVWVSVAEACIYVSSILLGLAIMAIAVILFIAGSVMTEINESIDALLELENNDDER